MEILRAGDYEGISRIAADLVERYVLNKPGCTIGFATGSSPFGVYRMLAERYRQGGISYQKVRGVQLDEYYGLEKEHKQSFYSYIKQNFMDKTDFQEEHFVAFDSLAVDIQKECRRYEKEVLSEGGVDLQILGVGDTGHIGFNEPDEAFSETAHCMKLEPETIEANARFFDSPDEVPGYAFTMGIGTIMKARKIILLVNGEGKADILKRVVCGRIGPRVPASVLRLHRDCTLIADDAALSLIDKTIQE